MDNLVVHVGPQLLHDELGQLREVLEGVRSFAHLIAYIYAHQRIAYEGKKAVTTGHTEPDSSGDFFKVQVEDYGH